MVGNHADARQLPVDVLDGASRKTWEKAPACPCSEMYGSLMNSGAPSRCCVVPAGCIFIASCIATCPRRRAQPHAHRSDEHRSLRNPNMLCGHGQSTTRSPSSYRIMLKLGLSSTASRQDAPLRISCTACHALLSESRPSSRTTAQPTHPPALLAQQARSFAYCALWLAHLRLSGDRRHNLRRARLKAYPSWLHHMVFDFLGCMLRALLSCCCVDLCAHSQRPSSTFVLVHCGPTRENER